MRKNHHFRPASAFFAPRAASNGRGDRCTRRSIARRPGERPVNSAMSARVKQCQTRQVLEITHRSRCSRRGIIHRRAPSPFESIDPHPDPARSTQVRPRTCPQIVQHYTLKSLSLCAIFMLFCQYPLCRGYHSTRY